MSVPSTGLYRALVVGTCWKLTARSQNWCSTWEQNDIRGQ
jgi:hypothetical protein